MKTNRILGAFGCLICALFLAFTLTGCSDAKSGASDGGDPCTEDEQCPVGMTCIGGICQTPGGDDDCDVNDDCPTGAGWRPT